MKKLHILLLLAVGLMCATATPAAAQGPKGPQGPVGPKRPSMQQFIQDKTQFVLREMKLSPADSARFAPVYTQLQVEKANLMRTHMQVGQDARKAYPGKKPEQWPDSVKLAMVRAEYRLGVEDATLELHYLGRFEQILTPEQLLRYTHAEKSFKQKFMNGGPQRPHREDKNSAKTATKEDKKPQK
jgi:Spy/CpxP family protein refolding chaperone